ncbi:Arrestin-like [Trypanosoma melophagium]|uniref:Arrestin-like n=1 Tax=Trypanosoma melophagium TaxID=715481 RepID=UPI00351A4A47|nr:Arrestin-like [Trypanosoma melophagium]
MASINRRNVELNLTFQSEMAEYLPGDVLTGVIKLKLSKEFSLRAIRLRIRSEEYARVGVGASPVTGSRIHYDKIYTFARELRKDESPINASLLLAETGDGAEDFMPPGEVLLPGLHEYPFSVDLPDFLPPSFEVRCKLDTAEARLAYTAKAYVDVRTGFNVECIKPFYLLSSISRVLYIKKMDEHSERTLISHVKLKDFLCCGMFCSSKKGRIVVTKVRVEPKVIIMDATTTAAGTVTTESEDYNGSNNLPVYVHVNIINESRKPLSSVRIRLINIVEIKLNQLRSTRCVDIGEPVIYNENIHRGEEKSFVAEIHPKTFLPFSVVDGDEKDNSELHHYAASPLIPRRKQKGYVLYEQPLMNVTTAFVSSHCAVTVDFPEYKSKETFMAADVLLAGTIGEANKCIGFPCVYDNKSFRKMSLSNNVYSLHPNMHDYTESPEEARYVSPILTRVKDPTGIFPAYTAGNWTYPKKSNNE